MRWRIAHLFALSGLAIAQPLLSLLGDNPTFFTAHDSGTAEIIWFALLLVVIPPALCSAVLLIVDRWSPRVGERVHRGFVALFGFLFVLPFVDGLPGPWFVVLLVAGGLAFGISELYGRVEEVRSLLSVLAAAPLVFILVFLFVAPANALVFPDDVDAIELDDLLDEIGEDSTGSVEDDLNDRFPPIFLLVLDELPWPSLVAENGEIDAVRYPNFARLASTAHVFEDTTAPGFQTEQSVPIILTGRQEVADAPVYSLYPNNLFTLLGGIYDASSSDPLVALCPPSVCNGQPPDAVLEMFGESDVDVTTPILSVPVDEASGSPFDLLLEDAAIVYGHLVTPDDLDIGLPSIGSSWGSFGRGVGARPTPSIQSTTPPLSLDPGVALDSDSAAPADAAAADRARTRFLQSLLTDDDRVADMRTHVTAITDRGVPQLDYLHVLLPHVPWRHHGDGSVYADVALPGYFERWNDADGVAALAQQRHLLQLQFIDRLLGEYLDQLETAGLFDRATVIVTADHGISFVGGLRSRGIFESNSGGIAAIPLIWKEPGQTDGVRHVEPVSPIDIVPTIAGRLGVDIPWEVDGIDLFGDLPAERERFVAGYGMFTPLPAEYDEKVDAVVATYHARFGTGATSVYSAGGHPELVGAPVGALVDLPAEACWVLERPRAIPEPAGEIGYVFGAVRTDEFSPIDFAIVVDGVVAGTSQTYGIEGEHRVFGLGDPQYWRASVSPVVELHQIIDGRLRPMFSC